MKLAAQMAFNAVASTTLQGANGGEGGEMMPSWNHAISDALNQPSVKACERCFERPSLEHQRGCPLSMA
jgi:hypothetical protein